MQDSSNLLTSDNFPKMTVEAALQFADEKCTTGGIMTCCALETLSEEVRRFKIANADWLAREDSMRKQQRKDTKELRALDAEISRLKDLLRKAENGWVRFG